MPGFGIYVETSIAAPLERVWELTQQPDLHEQWDLRFSTITYLPRAEGEPQQFLYTTHFGFGLAIAGKGESSGSAESATERTSALRFWSDSPLSVIQEGRGYWKYHNLTGAASSKVRFFTWYDYEVRWGALGRFLDIAFRPAIGWATAWSFDRLRLWAERGTPPTTTLRATLVYSVSRLGIIAIWAYHGAVPKLLFYDHDELALLAAQHLSAAWLPLAGAAEISLALLGLALWRWRGYFILTAVLMVLALAAVSLSAPVYLTHAFNPLTLNLSVALLCATGYWSQPDTAFAARCLRRRPARSAAKETL